MEISLKLTKDFESINEIVSRLEQFKNKDYLTVDGFNALIKEVSKNINIESIEIIRENGYKAVLNTSAGSKTINVVQKSANQDEKIKKHGRKLFSDLTNTIIEYNGKIYCHVVEDGIDVILALDVDKNNVLFAKYERTDNHGGGRTQDFAAENK